MYFYLKYCSAHNVDMINITTTKPCLSSVFSYYSFKYFTIIIFLSINNHVISQNISSNPQLVLILFSTHNMSKISPIQIYLIHECCTLVILKVITKRKFKLSIWFKKLTYLHHLFQFLSLYQYVKEILLHPIIDQINQRII